VTRGWINVYSKQIYRLCCTLTACLAVDEMGDSRNVCGTDEKRGQNLCGTA
jgi:hypothetical protein